MSDRQQMKALVTERLGDRRLVWAGLRGDDIEPLSDLPQLSAVLSMIGGYERRSTLTSTTYERLSGRRHDMELWDIDDHLDESATKEFRAALHQELAAPSALLPYRPSRFLSAVHFVRRGRAVYLGQFGAFQAAFEHKPWVESSLQDLGIPSVPWSYIADEDQLSMLRALRDGPLVLRRSRTSGGEGFELVDDPDRLLQRWPHSVEGFVSVAPFLPDTVAVNVGGTVWPDDISVHHPSVQLIGIPSCTDRAFGYCGNDFGAATCLDGDVLRQVEDSTLRVGTWLRGYGYRGTFGVDFLVSDGSALFTEVNPRFQGSTPASARLSFLDGEACLLLEHVAAMLGQGAIEAVRRPSRLSTHDLSTVVVHWLDSDAEVDVGDLIAAVQAWDSTARFDVLPPRGTTVERGGVVCRITVRRSVTSDGATLDPALAGIIDSWRLATASLGGEVGA